MKVNGFVNRGKGQRRVIGVDMPLQIRIVHYGKIFGRIPDPIDFTVFYKDVGELDEKQFYGGAEGGRSCTVEGDKSNHRLQPGISLH